MTASAPAVEVSDLGFNYGERRALDKVSFGVRRGEIFGLLGPNGGGKTTLFRILATLLPYNEGNILMFGLELSSSLTPVRERIGVVFQSPSLDTKLNVEENLTHHGHLYGLQGPRLRSAINRSLKRLGIDDRARDVVETLSGGLRRRVELAKGLMAGPKILIMDEPSTGLDPGARRDLWHHLGRLKEEDGTTILLTTHLMEEAGRCDRLAILDKGRIVSEGSPDGLRARIGGDVITIKTAAPEELSAGIERRFGEKPRRVDGTLRIEREDGHSFIKQLVELFPAVIDTVSVGKPTLEDVFVRETGHRFWTET